MQCRIQIVRERGEAQSGERTCACTDVWHFVNSPTLLHSSRSPAGKALTRQGPELQILLSVPSATLGVERQSQMPPWLNPAARVGSGCSVEPHRLKALAHKCGGASSLSQAPPGGGSPWRTWGCGTGYLFSCSGQKAMGLCLLGSQEALSTNRG